MPGRETGCRGHGVLFVTFTRVQTGSKLRRHWTGTSDRRHCPWRGCPVRGSGVPDEERPPPGMGRDEAERRAGLALAGSPRPWPRWAAEEWAEASS